MCRHRYQLSFRITKRCELSAKYASGIDADRIVEPLGFGNRRVAVNDHRLPAIIGGPVVTNRQAVFVRLSSRFAVHRKLANHPRTTPVHLFTEASMRHDETTTVEHVMAHETIQELSGR